MDLGRGAVWATVGVIAAVVVLSGPLVGAVDLTRPAPTVSPGDGTASVSVVSVPTAGVRFDRGEYGSGRYTLRVPDALIYVESVRGNPIVVYKLRVPELGYVRISLFVLRERHAGQRVRLTMAKDGMDPGRLQRDAYRGELLVLVRGDGEQRVLHGGNVTVHVRG